MQSTFQLNHLLRGNFSSISLLRSHYYVVFMQFFTHLAEIISDEEAFRITVYRTENIRLDGLATFIYA